MDFGKRAYDHSYHIDPIVRSLLDTDFYKLLMLQFIWQKHYYTQATFALTNRTRSVKLADCIDRSDLEAQLDHVRSLRFTPQELIWLRGQTFYGQDRLFTEGFIDFLRTFQLPPYRLGDDRHGQLTLEFDGVWRETSHWEIYALAIINEMRYRKTMETMSQSDLDITYARAKVKLYAKLEILKGLDGLALADFGTRRRHSFLWQEHCVMTAKEVLGDKFTGTSNALLAMRHGLEAVGTNAHELPMVLAAEAEDDKALREAQYEVLRQWQETYHGSLLVMLPDTFGTTQFLDHMDPIMAATWKGARPDSKEPIKAGEELIQFWSRTTAKPEDKLIIFSDGLDVALPGKAANGSDIPTLHRHFQGRVKIAFGWGTNLTNDFLDCPPEKPLALSPLSLVCKVVEAQGHPTVKLSDNYAKAQGYDPKALEHYRKVFGTAGMDNLPVKV